jgi:hypothetical protein
MNFYPVPQPLYYWQVISFYTRLSKDMESVLHLAPVFNVTLVY